MKLTPCFLLACLLPGSAWAVSSTNASAAEILALESPRIFGDMRNDIHMPNVLVVDAIREFMGPFQDERQLEHFAIVESCRKHSCIEKIAAVVDLKDRKLAAVALLNFRCRFYSLNPDEISSLVASGSTRALSTCDQTPTLSIYLMRQSLDAEPLKRESEALDELRKWGRGVGYSHEEIKVVRPSHQRQEHK